MDEITKIIVNELTTKKEELKEDTLEKVNLDVQIEKSGLVYIYNKEQKRWILIDNLSPTKNEKKQFSDKQLLEHLESFIQKSVKEGVHPSRSKFAKTYDKPSYTLYQRRFENWDNALERADSLKLIINANLEPLPSKKRYSKEELLIFLKEFVEMNKEDLSLTRYLKLKSKPSIETYNRHFGSFHKALNIILAKQKQSI